MKIKILNSEGKPGKDIELPGAFSSEIRSDILQKVFEAQKRKMDMGVGLLAGMDNSASGILRHKRHAWKVTYGKGISRTPRKIMSRHGSSFNWVGATAPNTRGGRRAHPPKVILNQFKKINKKELAIAMNSGLTGTADKNSLSKKYSVEVKENFPIVFDSSILNAKTKAFVSALQNAFGNLYERVEQRKETRAGKGKRRNRRYKTNAGLLFVVASDEKMNQSGVDIVKVNELTVKDLAPNGQAGRFACYTEKAIKEINEKFGK